MQLTFDQILEKIKENKISISDFARGRFGGGYQNKCTIDDEVGPCVEVDSYGGEGQGEEWYTVKRFVNHDVYIRIDAYYTSYEGVNFEYSKFLHVFPLEVKRIEYVPYQK